MCLRMDRYEKLWEAKKHGKRGRDGDEIVE